MRISRPSRAKRKLPIILSRTRPAKPKITPLIQPRDATDNVKEKAQDFKVNIKDEGESIKDNDVHLKDNAFDAISGVAGSVKDKVVDAKDAI